MAGHHLAWLLVQLGQFPRAGPPQAPFCVYVAFSTQLFQPGGFRIAAGLHLRIGVRGLKRGRRDRREAGSQAEVPRGWCQTLPTLPKSECGEGLYGHNLPAGKRYAGPLARFNLVPRFTHAHSLSSPQLWPGPALHGCQHPVSLMICVDSRVGVERKRENKVSRGVVLLLVLLPHPPPGGPP